MGRSRSLLVHWYSRRALLGLALLSIAGAVGLLARTAAADTWKTLYATTIQEENNLGWNSPDSARGGPVACTLGRMAQQFNGYTNGMCSGPTHECKDQFLEAIDFENYTLPAGEEVTQVYADVRAFTNGGSGTEGVRFLLRHSGNTLRDTTTTWNTSFVCSSIGDGWRFNSWNVSGYLANAGLFDAAGVNSIALWVQRANLTNRDLYVDAFQILVHSLKIKPATPTLSLGAVGTTSIALSWAPGGGGGPVESYNLYRNINGGGFVLYRTGLTSTSFTDVGLFEYTRYDYDVVAVNSDRSSNNSNIVGARTLNTAHHLSFVFSINTATAGAAITPVTVEVRDVNENPVATASNPITIGFNVNPAGGTLHGTLTLVPSNARATFGDLWIDKKGSGYRLSATSGSLSGISSAFDVIAAAPHHVSFLVQPTAAIAGSPVPPPPQVEIRDAFENRVTSPDYLVTIAIGSNPGGGTLTGTPSVTTSGGLASFGNLRIDRPGNPYTLVASAPSLASGTSAGFAVSPGAAVRMAFTTQPGDAAAGARLTPAPVVTLFDALDNVATTSALSVTVALATGGGSLQGTLQRVASNGRATFGDLSIAQSGSGYSLRATCGGLSDQVSNPFAVLASSATHLTVLTQPDTSRAGRAIQPSLQIAVRDSFNNLVTSPAYGVTVSLQSNPGGSSLTGTLTRLSVNGVATFDDLVLDRPGVGYTLQFAAPPLTGIVSTSFDVAHGFPHHLTIAPAPANVAAGAPFTAMTVTVRDVVENPTTSMVSSISVALSPSAPLAGTVTRLTSNGAAVFNDLSTTRSGTGYVLVASTPGRPNVSSAGFDVSPGAVTHLTWTSEPDSGVAGQALTPVARLEARDGFENVVASPATTVTLALGSNPGGGTLTGTLQRTTTGGAVVFDDLRINRPGVGYRLAASAASIPVATGSAFDIVHGPPQILTFSTPPTSTTAGAILSPSPVVAILDGLGNLATSSTLPVTVSLAVNPGAAALQGTLTRNASAGRATFDDLRLTVAASGYRLRATASGTRDTVSGPFDVAPGSPQTLRISLAPSDAMVGVALQPTPTVTLTDAFGNLVTGASGMVTLALGANPGGAALSGTVSRALTGGQASFPGLALDRPGAGYTLSASTTTLVSTPSPAFNVGGIVIDKVSPQEAPSDGSVTLEITGRGFAPGTSVRLVRGATTLFGLCDVDVRGKFVTASFELNEVPAGPADVIVVSGADSAVVTHALDVVNKKPKNGLRIELYGPDKIRAGQPWQFQVQVGNAGSKDEILVPVWIQGIPEDAVVAIGGTRVAPAPVSGAPDWTRVSDTFTYDGERVAAFVLSRVPKNKWVAVPFTVTVPATVSDFQMEAATRPTWMPSTDQAKSELKNCLNDLFSNGTCLVGELGALATTLQQAPGTPWMSGHALWNKVAWQCYSHDSTAANTRAEEALERLAALSGTTTGACKKLASEIALTLDSVEVVGSLDPNDKRGPAGGGAAHFIAGDQPIPYTIHFENLATATAAAAEVVVTDSLDASVFDVAASSLGPVRIGAVDYVPPPGVLADSAWIDLRPALGVVVRLEAAIDPYAAVATWRFHAIDVTTGVAPLDPDVGLLPPNQTPPEGEGSVSLFAQPRSTLATGAVLNNRARVVFDANAPLVTPAWSNVVDHDPPASGIAALPPSLSTASVPLDLSGSDVGAGVARWSIYAAEDGGEYELWHVTGAPADTFPGRPGHRYSFYTVAMDSAGNVEEPPDSADATTTIDARVGVDPIPAVPALRFAFHGVRPNPARRAVALDLTVPGTEAVRIALVDVSGRVVESRTLHAPAAGRDRFLWSPDRRVRPGVYWIRVQYGRESQSRKLVFLD